MKSKSIILRIVSFVVLVFGLNLWNSSESLAARLPGSGFSVLGKSGIPKGPKPTKPVSPSTSSHNTTPIAPGPSVGARLRSSTSLSGPGIQAPSLPSNTVTSVIDRARLGGMPSQRSAVMSGRPLDAAGASLGRDYRMIRPGVYVNSRTGKIGPAKNRAAPNNVDNRPSGAIDTYASISKGQETEGISAARGAAQLTGQMHHGISRTVHKALEAHPNLKGLYGARDSRFVTQAKDLASHRGYDTFHRNIDAEVAGWVRGNPNATAQQFESYLRGVYQRPDVLTRFPGGL